MEAVRLGKLITMLQAQRQLLISGLCKTAAEALGQNQEQFNIIIIIDQFKTNLLNQKSACTIEPLLK